MPVQYIPHQTHASKIHQTHANTLNAWRQVEGKGPGPRRATSSEAGVAGLTGCIQVYISATVTPVRNGVVEVRWSDGDRCRRTQPHTRMSTSTTTTTNSNTIAGPTWRSNRHSGVAVAAGHNDRDAQRDSPLHRRLHDGARRAHCGQVQDLARGRRHVCDDELDARDDV
jgi:hypothetical protein